MKRRAWKTYLLVAAIGIASAEVFVTPLMPGARPAIVARVESGVAFTLAGLLLLVLANRGSQRAGEYHDAALFALGAALCFFVVALARVVLGV